MADAAAWVTAVASLVLAVVALFQDWFRARLFPPTLRVHLTPSPPDCHKTQIVQRTMLAPDQISEARADCYYFRIRVKNEGFNRAESVEVFAAELWEKRFDSFERVRDFLPMNLKWSHTGGVYFPSIARDMEKHCDLGHIIDPGRRAAFEYEDLRYVAPRHTIFSLDLQVQSFRLTHLLRPGTYRLKLLIAATNARPVPTTLEIAHEQWHDEESRMLAEPIVRLVHDGA